MPELTPFEYEALKADIAAHGVLVPVEVDEDGELLDGHHRVRAWQELRDEGRELPAYSRLVRKGMSEEEKFNHAYRLNLLHRTLTLEQRDAAIREMRARGVTYQKIADTMGLSVGKVHSVASEVELFNSEKLRGADGKYRPPTYQHAPKMPPQSLFVPGPDVALDPVAALQQVTETNQARTEAKRSEVRAALEDIEVQETKAVQGVYDVIVIDPPWPIKKIERYVAPDQVELDYPTMTLDEIEALSPPCADNCHVFVWTTQKYLPVTLELLDTWGLSYILTFVWHKNGGFQPYGLPQYNCEFAVYARKGSPQFVDLKDFPTCFEAKRTSHSEKPETFYDLLRRVTAGRRLDMFNRRAIVGFDSWGNEAA